MKKATFQIFATLIAYQIYMEPGYSYVSNIGRECQIHKGFPVKVSPFVFSNTDNKTIKVL